MAAEILAALRSSCERLEIAGSVRRGKAVVHDVELVYVSRVTEEAEAGALFGTTRVLQAEVAIQRLLAEGVLAQRLSVAGVATWGAQNKLGVHVASGLPVDLFATTAECWWNYLVCRTGPAEWNQQIAMRARALGLRWHPYGKGFTRADGTWVVCGSEREVMETVGMEWAEPQNRK